MPVVGRKPKADGQKRNRVKPVHDWFEVVDVPYDGPRPDLPSRRSLVTRSGTVQRGFLAMTKAWWETVSTMPHCVLWSSADWQFALTTAVVADDVFRGSSKAAAELRQREKIMGTTFDARRDLRIRYVDPVEDDERQEEGEEDASAPANVSSIDERRRRLTSDAS